MGSPRGDELRTWAKAQLEVRGQVAALSRRVRPLGRDAIDVQRSFAWEGPFEREMRNRTMRVGNLLGVAADQLQHAASQLDRKAIEYQARAVVEDAKHQASKLNPFG